ncbi:MAG: glycosyltransferase family 4 protein [Cyanobacteriota bacterium]|jgi:glycosyltransferase involved in cell wall biosynthesis
MNILVISNCDLDCTQGSGYVISGYASGFRSLGHHVNAFQPEDYILFPGVFKFKRLRMFIGYTLFSLRMAFKLRSKLDIIELWGSMSWLACLILAAIPNRKYCVINRSNGLEPHLRSVMSKQYKDSFLRVILSKFESFCDEIGYRAADVLTVVSFYDFDYANRRQYNSNLVLLENPLPDSWLRQSIRPRSDNLTAGFVGSWVDRKGKNQLLQIINKLDDSNSQTRWIIVGVGSEGNHDIIANTTLDKIQVFQHVTREELYNLYQKMDVLLCLSVYESFGMVCSEAMSCGCIVLSTPVGFVTNLRPNIDYIPVCLNDTDSIARIIIDIEKNRNNYGFIAKYSYERSQLLEWKPTINKLLSIYQQAISNKLKVIKNFQKL